MAGTECIVEKTREKVEDFLSHQEYCSVCRRYFAGILAILKKVQAGDASREDYRALEEFAFQVKNNCHCGTGRQTGEEILSELKQYEEEFLVHIDNKVCPSSRCPGLVLSPCQAACPAGIDIPNYIALVGKGRYEEALERIREDVPFPGSLGRICEHPCEKACRRAEVDGAVSICALKRLAYDRTNKKGIKMPVPAAKTKDSSIAIIGAGPAGLSAAYYLVQKGYGVTVFEAMPEAGGMLAYGIPPYRLPREVLRDEIAYIEAAGVEIRLNTPVSGEEDIKALREQGYDAVFLATGAWKGSVPVSGAAYLDNVYDGVTFLREINRNLNQGASNYKLKNKKVVVFGGGNVAIDAARVSKRLGAREVRIVYRRTREEMPALPEEIEDAEKEGILFDFLVSPTGVEEQGGQAVQVKCFRSELGEPDDSGRRRPVPVENSGFLMDVDLLVFATGQNPDLSFLEGSLQQIVSPKAIDADLDKTVTSLPGVFAGGDAVTGPASAIKAIAAGKRAAGAIDAYLHGEDPPAGLQYPVKRKSIDPLPSSVEEKAAAGRGDPHLRYQEEKQGTFEEIMQVIDEEAASAEANRCLRCDICIACGNCVDVCQNEVGVGALQLGYTGDENRSAGTDFYRPAGKCIACGACAVSCPTGAITLEDREGYRQMRMCGTLLSSSILVACSVCGKEYVTKKHLEFINEKTSENGGKMTGEPVCPECARKTWPRAVFGMKIS